MSDPQKELSMLSNNKYSAFSSALKGKCFYVLSRKIDTIIQYNRIPKIYTVNRQHAEFILFRKQAGKFSIILCPIQTDGAYYIRLYWIIGLLLCKSICVCDYRHSFFSNSICIIVWTVSSVTYSELSPDGSKNIFY